MINPIKSLQSRKQSKDSQNFEKTKYGKQLAALKNIHKGEICFVIGNGPSLTPEDLQTLHDNHVITFATNRIYNMFDKTSWRPAYYVSEDINVIRNVKKEVEAVESERKFLPVNLKWYEDFDIPGADYFYIDYSEDFSENYGLSLDIAHSIRCRATVTTTCIQIAIYMGFSEIYLLGVDHSFAKMVDKNGNVIEDRSIRSHFTDDYNSDIPDLGYNIDATTEAYFNVEQLSHKLKTFRVYNATRGGKLEVFERKDFDELFKK